MTYSKIAIELIFTILALTILSLLIRLLYKKNGRCPSHTGVIHIITMGISVLSFVLLLVSISIEPTNFDLIGQQVPSIEPDSDTTISMVQEATTNYVNGTDLRFQTMMNVQYAHWAFYALSTLLTIF